MEHFKSFRFSHPSKKWLEQIFVLFFIVKVFPHFQKMSSKVFFAFLSFFWKQKLLKTCKDVTFPWSKCDRALTNGCGFKSLLLIDKFTPVFNVKNYFLGEICKVKLWVSKNWPKFCLIPEKAFELQVNASKGNNYEQKNTHENIHESLYGIFKF